MSKTATVSMHGNKYQVDPALTGRRVELVFDPFDLTVLSVRSGGKAHPTGAWTVQQARNLAMDLGERVSTPRFLIHDRDPLFTTAFGEVFTSEGLRTITTMPKTPRMNAICEHVLGTLRRELLDRVLILDERHLDLVLREYLTHYNRYRPAPVPAAASPGHRKPAPAGRDRPAVRPPKTRRRGNHQRISPRRITAAQIT